MKNNQWTPSGRSYRANLISGTGRVHMSIPVPAETDAEARRRVIGFTRSHTVELFDHGRLVAALKVEQSRSS